MDSPICSSKKYSWKQVKKMSAVMLEQTKIWRMSARDRRLVQVSKWNSVTSYAENAVWGKTTAQDTIKVNNALRESLTSHASFIDRRDSLSLSRPYSRRWNVICSRIRQHSFLRRRIAMKVIVKAMLLALGKRKSHGTIRIRDISRSFWEAPDSLMTAKVKIRKMNFKQFWF